MSEGKPPSTGGAAGAANGAEPQGKPTVAALPSILMRMSQDVTSALHSLYRSHDFLKQAAVQRLTGTRSRLADLSTTTETAAHRLLDGLDNALVLIDELAGAPQGTVKAEALHGQLREEVHGLIMSIQFQDIVAQQIAYAMSVLEDTESRIHHVAEHLEDMFGKGDPTVLPEGVDGAFDPGASTFDIEGRQSLADSIFGSPPADHG